MKHLKLLLLISFLSTFCGSAEATKDEMVRTLDDMIETFSPVQKSESKDLMGLTVDNVVELELKKNNANKYMPKAPAQSQLDHILSKTTNVKIYDSIIVESIGVGSNVVTFLLVSEVNSKKQIEKLKSSLQIIDNISQGNCFCLASYRITLFDGDTKLDELTFVSGDIFNSNLWSVDAKLQDGRKILDWLENNGYTKAKKDFGDDFNNI